MGSFYLLFVHELLQMFQDVLACHKLPVVGYRHHPLLCHAHKQYRNCRQGLVCVQQNVNLAQTGEVLPVWYQ